MTDIQKYAANQAYFPQNSAREFQRVRCFSELLSEPLAPEDFVVQSMPDCSPAKWHLAHTSWFFETFVLRRFIDGYESPFPAYNFLFNSYYNAVGERHARAHRGLLSRPTVAETFAYRHYVDERIGALLEENHSPELRKLVVLGLHHEQQHQELLLTDIKHLFAQNPLHPIYKSRAPHETQSAPTAGAAWLNFDAGVYQIGFNGDGFCFDNESPRHKKWLDAFALSTRLVTCGEYLEFIEDGGYTRAELWLSLGWNAVQENHWRAPLYWERNGDAWQIMTLHGLRPIESDEPLCHVSYFEADAFARWRSTRESGVRLPNEAEWEIAAASRAICGNFAESENFHPVSETAMRDQSATCDPQCAMLLGNVWNWTRSQYEPYPRYVADAGALGEYNGKFMCNQFVLRGGSCATPQSHIRATYRNFFPPEARWQFSGIRLAKDLR